jgi:hypothetical protein
MNYWRSNMKKTITGIALVLLTICIMVEQAWAVMDKEIFFKEI